MGTKNSKFIPIWGPDLQLGLLRSDLFELTSLISSYPLIKSDQIIVDI